MNSKKAIELTKILLINFDTQLDYDETKALKLGIEALKLYDHNRHIGQHVDPAFLPGETPPKPPHAIGFNTGDDESS